ncbi:MAG TPA: FecR domain-containing protein [Polyangia bacterium]|nr:FecR domain-containing protein [Polyangia bacterium]
MTRPGWPDGDDPIAAELRQALDDAQQRLPDDMTLRRGWSAIDAGAETGRRGARLSWFAGGMATTAAVALACAAWLWPRNVESPGMTQAQAQAPTEMRRLTLEGGVVAELQHTSKMSIEESGARVEGGTVRFKVPHRRPGHPFVVRADRFRVVVIGTRFGVGVAGDRRVDVDVDEGVVEVWNGEARVARLEPGQRWSGQPEAESPPAPAPTQVAADKALEKQELPQTVPADRTAPRAVEPETTLQMRSDSRHHRSGRAATSIAMIESPSRAGGGAAESPRAARDALAAGDAPKALEIYKNLAQKTGPVAENASYEIGRIQSERGQYAAAVATWRHYRSDYPNGILRVETDVSIIETLARAGETDDALSEAIDFLRRRPDSERRGEIARVTGDLYRGRGDCRHAIGAYQLAMSASRARDVVEAATFHRGECMVRAGDGGGVDALRGYLRAYPEGRFRRQATELAEQATSKTAGK